MPGALMPAFMAWWINTAMKWTITVLWLGINGFVCWRSFLFYKMDPKFFYLHEMLGAGLCVSRATASLINLNLGMLLLPMCRLFTSLLHHPALRFSKQTMRIMLDNCKGFHELCAWLLTLSSVVHFSGHCFNAYNFSVNYSFRFPHLNAAAYKGQSPVLIVVNSVPGTTGLFLTLILLILITTATLRVRHRKYNVFWYSHRLFIAFYILVLIHAFRGILTEQINLSEHVPGCMCLNLTRPSLDSSSPGTESDPSPGLPAAERKCVEEAKFAAIGSSSWMWITGPAVLYAFDSLYRYIYSRRHPVSVTCIVFHPPEVVEIEMSRDGFICRPGQFVLLQSPEVSRFEWHPFTVSRCPGEGDSRFVLHIKISSGDWSARLFDHLRQTTANTGSSHLPSLPLQSGKFFIDGPFGSPMENVLRYRISICVAGGIGITPFAAILNHIRGRAPETLKTERLYLFWMSRDVELFLSFANLLRDTYLRLWLVNRPDMVSFRLYITRSISQSLVQGLVEECGYGILAKRVTVGRPNWEEILERIASSHKGENIGVFSCGPKSLNRQLNRLCSTRTFHRTVFEFFHESF